MNTTSVPTEELKEMQDRLERYEIVEKAVIKINQSLLLDIELLRKENARLIKIIEEKNGN